MPTAKKELKERLARYRQISITVIGRKSGKKISVPVWSVLEGKTLYLVPVRGSDTQWYQNLLHEPWIRISARGAEAEFQAKPVTGAPAVASIVRKFREKYGAADAKRYYSKFDVAVQVELEN
jgi:deazaflavin-dependent oxidoreductase (nitroreductase family)